MTTEQIDFLRYRDWIAPYATFCPLICSTLYFLLCDEVLEGEEDDNDRTD